MQLNHMNDMQIFSKGFENKWSSRLIKDLETIVVKQANSTTFKIDFIIGYLKIIVKLIIIVDLQINQCKISIHFLAFSLLIKVQYQLIVRTFRLSIVNSTKVQFQLNFTMSNHVYSFVSSPNRKLN